jgi:preprotein translocase subunit SecG
MRISEDHVYFVVVVVGIIVILGILIFVLLTKSKTKLTMNASDQNLFMKLHGRSTKSKIFQ